MGTSVPTITLMSTIHELMYFLSSTCQDPDDLDEVKSILIKRENNFKMELDRLRKNVDNIQEEYELTELEKTKYENELIQCRKECCELKEKILELNENHEVKIKALEAEKVEIEEKMEVYKRQYEDSKEKMSKTKGNIEKVFEIDERGILGKNIGNERNGSYDSEMKGSQLNPEAEGSRKVTSQLASDPTVINLSESEDDDLPTNQTPCLSNNQELENKKTEKIYVTYTRRKRKRSKSEGVEENGDSVSLQKIRLDEIDNNGDNVEESVSQSQIMKPCDNKSCENSEKVLKVDARGILGKDIVGKERNGSCDNSGTEGASEQIPEEEQTKQYQGSQLNPEAEGSKKVTPDPIVIDLSESDDDLPISGTQCFNLNKANESQQNYTWIYPTDMILDFKKDPKLCMNAVCALYRQKSKGFRNLDIPWGTALAKYLINNDPKNRLNRSVSEVKEKHLQMVESCEKMAVDYYKQLFEIYENKLDPFFPS